MTGWNIHACILDARCRKYGAPHRLHIGTPWGQLILAIGCHSWTQAWLPFRGYQTWWSPVAWHPKAKETNR